MSSGDAEAPPTYYFSVMTFNPDFYTTSTSTYNKNYRKEIFFNLSESARR